MGKTVPLPRGDSEWARRARARLIADDLKVWWASAVIAALMLSGAALIILAALR